MEFNFLTVIAFTAGIVVYWAWNKYVWPNRHAAYTWVFAFRRNDRLGEPCPSDLLLKRKGYTLGYSYNHRSALWVSYIISQISVKINKDRAGSFKADMDIPEKWRTTPDDFKNTGFDKGHLAPSGSIDYSRKSNDETFLLSNVTLQHAQLNRRAWRSLENNSRNWTVDKGRLYVVTGPLFNKRPERINNIAVPSSFYKVVYSFKHVQAIAFLFPNDTVNAKDMWEYVMTVQELEEKTGHHFLSRLGWHKRRCKKRLDLNFWQTTK